MFWIVGESWVLELKLKVFHIKNAFIVVHVWKKIAVKIKEESC